MDDLADELSETLTVSSTEGEKKRLTHEAELFPRSGELTHDQVDIHDEPGCSPTSVGSHSSLIDPFVSCERDLSDDEDSNDSGVVESKARLVPACWEYHPLHKGKAREDSPSTSRKPARQCGDWDICYQHIFLPLSAADGTSYRLTTSKPEEDLKRWLLTPNDALDGTNEQRTREFILNDPRYDRNIIFTTLVLASEQIRAEISHIDSLLSYAARFPYDLSFSFNDDLSSIFQREKAVECDLLEADHEKLGEELSRAAEDLDFLKERASWVSAEILRCKVEAARGGEWAEVEWLVGMGMVDEGWMGENCCV